MIHRHFPNTCFTPPKHTGPQVPNSSWWTAYAHFARHSCVRGLNLIYRPGLLQRRCILESRCQSTSLLASSASYLKCNFASVVFNSSHASLYTRTISNDEWIRMTITHPRPRQDLVPIENGWLASTASCWFPRPSQRSGLKVQGSVKLDELILAAIGLVDTKVYYLSEKWHLALKLYLHPRE